MLSKETSSSNASEKNKTCISSRNRIYNLKYPKVKRGELYICDFGEPYGSEQGYKRFALIVQNNVGNRTSPTTIVVACTTKAKNNLPVHYQFNLSPSIMKDYNEKRIGEEVYGNIILAEQIKTVDKKRLRKFVGTMTDEFMDEVQRVIDISLDLKREKTTPIRPVQDLSIIQIQLLAKANIEKLLEVSEAEESNEVKIEKILKLFGFNMKTDGIQYLTKAIYLAIRKDNFTIEELSEELSNEEKDINKEEIKERIISVMEEKLKFEKSVAIDFIRLVNILLNQKPVYELKEMDSAEENVGKIENLLYQYLKNDLESIDRSKTIEENVDYFLEGIGMSADEMIMQSFIIACNIKRITYMNVIAKMIKLYPEKESREIKTFLKDNFKEWLEKNPELEMQCGTISFMNLLKIFSKQFA